jgi:hypothetical protein
MGGEIDAFWLDQERQEQRAAAGRTAWERLAAVRRCLERASEYVEDSPETMWRYVRLAMVNAG